MQIHGDISSECAPWLDSPPCTTRVELRAEMEVQKTSVCAETAGGAEWIQEFLKMYYTLSLNRRPPIHTIPPFPMSSDSPRLVALPVAAAPESPSAGVRKRLAHYFAATMEYFKCALPQTARTLAFRHRSLNLCIPSSSFLYLRSASHH
jgi:hypothetical protein